MANNFSINEFLGKITGGIARTQLFKVIIADPIVGNPSASSVKDVAAQTNTSQKVASLADLSFFCYSTGLPADTISKVGVSYMGRKINLAGERSYDGSWKVNIYNDENFAIRRAMERWNHKINLPWQNVRDFTDSNPSKYRSTATIIQFAKTGEEIRRYTMYNVWPHVVGGLTYSWENEALQTFDVDFSYDYWLSEEDTAPGGDASA